MTLFVTEQEQQEELGILGVGLLDRVDTRDASASQKRQIRKCGANIDQGKKLAILQSLFFFFIEDDDGDDGDDDNAGGDVDADEEEEEDDDDDVRGVVLETVGRRKDKLLPKFMSLGIVVDPDKYNFKLVNGDDDDDDGNEDDDFNDVIDIN